MGPIYLYLHQPPAILGMDFAGVIEALGEGVHNYQVGDVGHIAIQLANYFGAKTFLTGGGDKQLALIEQLGATAINYKNESVSDYVNQYTDGAGFDLMFDSVGGENMTNSFEAAKLNGQVTSTVSLVNLDLSTAHFKGLSLHVVFMLIPMLHNTGRGQHHTILKVLADIAEAGKLTPVLDEQTYSLEQVSAAHARLESGKGMGKVVVSI